MIIDGVEFWRLNTVAKVVGLSRSEIYRRMEKGTFPASRPYPDSILRFWLSTDVQEWQAQALGEPLKPSPG